MAKIYHYLNINASPAKVYAAISTVAGLKSWWTNLVTGSTEKGGELRFGFGKDYDLMRVTANEKDKFVSWEVFESTFKEGYQWLGTSVSFTLEEDSKGNTIMKFEHDRWKDQTDFYGVCNYHWGIFMVSLKSLCETGKGNPQVTSSE